MKKSITFAAVAICFAILYFLPVSIPFKICLVVGTLTIGSLGSLSWLMCLAFAFSCTGDAMGAAHNFLMQMLFFMFTHISLIAFFTSGLKGKKKILDARGVTGLAIILCILIIAFTMIVPNAPEGIIRTGCVTYAVLIGLMCWLACLQGNKILAIGALLFLFSDFVLAWNKFTSPLQYSGYLILVPYFAGQICLFLGAFSLKDISCVSRK